MADDSELEKLWHSDGTFILLNPEETGTARVSLKVLRAVVAYLDGEGLVLRSDIQGFLAGTQATPDTLVQITPHSIAVASGDL